MNMQCELRRPLQAHFTARLLTSPTRPLISAALCVRTAHSFWLERLWTRRLKPGIHTTGGGVATFSDACHFTVKFGRKGQVLQLVTSPAPSDIAKQAHSLTGPSHTTMPNINLNPKGLTSSLSDADPFGKQPIGAYLQPPFRFLPST